MPQDRNKELRTYIETLMPFSEGAWNVLDSCLSEALFQRREALLKEGEVCDAVFFIQSGACKAVQTLDGTEINTAFYFEHDFVSNVNSLSSGTPSSYAILALEKTKALRLDKLKLLQAYNASHEVERFGRKILEMLIAKQELHANSFKLLSPKQRFDQLVTQQPDLLQRVSLTQIASYLGISRETLSRFRAQP